MKNTVVVFESVNKEIAISIFPMEDNGEWLKLIESLNKGVEDEESIHNTRLV